VALNDSVTAVHAKIQAAWNADTAITTFYDVGISGTSIQLTNKAVAGLFPAPDSTLNIAVQLGTAAGIIEDLKSLALSVGRAGTPAGSLLDHEGNAIPSLASVQGVLIQVASGTGTITGTAADSIAYAAGQVITLIRPGGITTDLADTLTITADTETDITISVIGAVSTGGGDFATQVVTVDFLGYGGSASTQDITIGGRVYHYSFDVTGNAGYVYAGTSPDELARSIVHAINGTLPTPSPTPPIYDAELTPPHATVDAEFIGSTWPLATFRITAKTAGAAGNSIATTSTCPAVIFAAATLTGGSD
jgi:hypothetical protein